MTSYYTQAQYDAQIVVLRSLIEDDERRLAGLHTLPADVRAAHERTIRMRLAHYAKRLEEIKLKA